MSRSDIEANRGQGTKGGQFGFARGTVGERRAQERSEALSDGLTRASTGMERARRQLAQATTDAAVGEVSKWFPTAAKVAWSCDEIDEYGAQLADMKVADADGVELGSIAWGEVYDSDGESVVEEGTSDAMEAWERLGNLFNERAIFAGIDHVTTADPPSFETASHRIAPAVAPQSYGMFSPEGDEVVGRAFAEVYAEYGAPSMSRTDESAAYEFIEEVQKRADHIGHREGIETSEVSDTAVREALWANWDSVSTLAD